MKGLISRCKFWWQNLAAREPSYELLGFLLLLGVALLTRFTALDYPAEVVFDEVHFGKFVTAYSVTGERFFDLHPPLGKLLIAAFAKLSGYHGGDSFEYIGQHADAISMTMLRLFPAIIGTALPLVMWSLVRLLGGSWLAALAAGLCLCLDGSFLVQARMVSLDGILVFAQAASLAAFLLAWRWQGWQRYMWGAMAGALAGMALGTKLTGLAVAGLAGVIFLVNVWRERGRVPWYQPLVFGAVFVLALATVYLGSWYAHWALLTKPGSGDAFYLPTGNFWVDVVAIHRISYNYNLLMTMQHPDASHWWQWPLMVKPIYYWRKERAIIYFAGNPLLWTGSFLLVVAATVGTCRQLFQRLTTGTPGGKEGPQVWVPLLGFVLAYLPMVGIARVMFLYHYLTPLMYAILAACLWLDKYQLFTLPKVGRQRVVYITAGLVFLLSFCVLAPLHYGIPLPFGMTDRVVFFLANWNF